MALSPKQLEANRRNALASTGPGAAGQPRPVGALESLLADRIVATAWRLRRLGRVEAGILDWSMNGRLALRARLRLPESKRAPRLSPAQEEDRRYSARQEADVCTLGVTFIGEAEPLSILSRYQASLEPAVHRALHELQRLQAARSGAFVPPPLAVDLDVASNHPLHLNDQP